MRLYGADRASGSGRGVSANLTRQVLSHPGFASTWAYLETPTNAYASPSGQARVLGYLGLTTQDGTSELLFEQQRVFSHGAWWVQVRLPLRPAGQIGWVPQRTLGAPQTVHTYLVVSTERTTLTLYKNGKVIFFTRVGTGKPSTPTPHGHFYIRDRLNGFPADSEYGPTRVRHLGALQRRNRLARRGRDRDPRHQRAVADPRTSIAWLHPAAELGDRQAGEAAPDRHAADDRLTRSGL